MRKTRPGQPPNMSHCTIQWRHSCCQFRLVLPVGAFHKPAHPLPSPVPWSVSVNNCPYYYRIIIGPIDNVSMVGLDVSSSIDMFNEQDYQLAGLVKQSCKVVSDCGPLSFFICLSQSSSFYRLCDNRSTFFLTEMFLNDNVEDAVFQ